MGRCKFFNVIFLKFSTKFPTYKMFMAFIPLIKYLYIFFYNPVATLQWKVLAHAAYPFKYLASQMI